MEVSQTAIQSNSQKGPGNSQAKHGLQRNPINTRNGVALASLPDSATGKAHPSGSILTTNLTMNMRAEKMELL
jgi:hypothetical protein